MTKVGSHPLVLRQLARHGWRLGTIRKIVRSRSIPRECGLHDRVSETDWVARGMTEEGAIYRPDDSSLVFLRARIAEWYAARAG